MFIDVDVERRIHEVIIVLSQGGKLLCLHTSTVTVFVLVAIPGSDSSGKSSRPQILHHAWESPGLQVVDHPKPRRH